MLYLTIIIRLSFIARIWEIAKEEGVIRRGRRARWITSTSIIILLKKPHSIIVTYPYQTGKRFLIMACAMAIFAMLFRFPLGKDILAWTVNTLKKN